MIDRLRRFIFFCLSFFACYVIFTNIYGSWSTPPPQTKLDRLQTDLVLQALSSDWLKQNVGQDIINIFYQNALQEYQQVKDQSQVIHQVGLLLIKNDRVDQALNLWQEEDELTTVLKALWHSPPSALPNGDSLIKQDLNGWYEYFALHRFYEVARPESVAILDLQQTIEAEAALLRLIIINLIPVCGSVIGGGILLFYLIKLRNYIPLDWSIPWSLETLWQLLVSWFICYTLISQFLPQLMRPWLPNSANSQALIVSTTYFVSMLPMIAIFAISFRKFSGWQKVFNLQSINPRVILWAIGGYLAAIPLVVSIAIAQQLFLRGHGGGNPLLEIISQSQNNVSILLFWVTLAVSAPVFEELIFRGFVFPSLTKYMPNNLSLWLSALLFALVHMNINDILPLTLLGVVLGTVYDRTRNIFTPILLHSLWNTGSFISLLLIVS